MRTRMEMALETLVFSPFNHLTWLIAREDFIISEVLAASIIRAMMMEAASTSEMLVNFYQTTRCYNPEDIHLLT
jgi:hypothetical protein